MKMEKVKENYPTKLLKLYLLITFFYGLLGFLDAIFFSRGPIGDVNAYHYLATLAFLSFFFLSIIALVSFIQIRLPKITLVLPAYAIATKIAIVVSAFAWASELVKANVAVEMLPVPGMLVNIAIAFSLFECVFSVYLLRKFDFI